MTFTCRTCKWWTSLNGVCVCGYSGRPTVMDDSCEAWNAKGSDIDMLIRSALDAGATVRKVKPGDGGIFVNGRRLTDGNLEECILNPKPPTNADRIRAMSDEELADEILRWFNWLNAVYWDDHRIINWLREEYKSES